jgi:HD-GYP domain-containing protein (c-di-GMP phosphodiesterase class II)
MAIPDSILLKPGPLTTAEWEIVRQHPRYAYELLSPIPYLGPALDIPHYHHERWDGAGYPHGLKENQIPLPARLFAVVDVHDALISHRPYRPAWKPDAAVTYIRSEIGRHFDRNTVEFLAMLEGSAKQACFLIRMMRCSLEQERRSWTAFLFATAFINR